MKTLSDIIRETVARMQDDAQEPTLASDEEVARKVAQMAERGFIPGEQWVEPIRAYLSGFGVMLAGDTGVGKTFFFTCLQGRVRSVEEIVDHGFKYLREWYSWTDGSDIVIDDLGSEPVTVEYGARDDLLKTVISHRDGLANVRTHITTNLSAEGISARYGDRTLSRILGMCKAFRLDGESRRQARPQGRKGVG